MVVVGLPIGGATLQRTGKGYVERISFSGTVK